MIEEKKSLHKHQVVMDRRENVSVTGVVDVISFDEEAVVAETDLGVLIVRGTNLHVNKLNLENGELAVDGSFYSLTYEDAGYAKGKSSFFSRLFK